MRAGDRPLRRGYGQREERQRILVYCEGERTEVDYFKGLRRDLRASTVRLEIVPGGGEPYGLVESAIKHQERAPNSQADGFEPYEQTWCVFDVEAPRQHARLAAALALARRNDIRCAVSNPCFELFLLLHLQDQTAYLTTEKACRLLERSPCGYRRNGKGVDYDAVRPGQQEAIRRAAQLDRRHADTPLPDRNPWTDVHLLLDVLLRQR